MASEAQRAHLHALMHFTLAHERQIHYAQRRPMATVRLSEAQLGTILAHHGSVTMDCSEGVTCLCKWAGLHDPNGLGYDGYGYTGTLLEHLPHYSDPAKAYVGALVAFGPGAGDHVAMVMKRGTNPVLWSHGSEGGPRAVPLSTENAIHRKPTTFLSIAHL